MLDQWSKRTTERLITTHHQIINLLPAWLLPCKGGFRRGLLLTGRCGHCGQGGRTAHLVRPTSRYLYSSSRARCPEISLIILSGMPACLSGVAVRREGGCHPFQANGCIASQNPTTWPSPAEMPFFHAGQETRTPAAGVGDTVSILTLRLLDDGMVLAASLPWCYVHGL